MSDSHHRDRDSYDTLLLQSVEQMMTHVSHIRLPIDHQKKIHPDILHRSMSDLHQSIPLQSVQKTNLRGILQNFHHLIHHGIILLMILHGIHLLHHQMSHHMIEKLLLLVG